MPPRLRIGIDLGGTKIAAIALGPADETLASLRVTAPREDYDGTLRAVAGLVARIERDTGLAGTVGVGIPGSISPGTGLVQNANSTWLNGKPFDCDLAAALGRPVRLANDANCFALSEAADGAGRGAGSLFGVILGTGCGGGFVFAGAIVTGAHAIGGEWGHNPLPWAGVEELPGPRCWCGRHGCLETWLSGPGLSRDHRRATGQDCSGEEIAARAAAGEAAAEAALARHADRLGRGLAHVINIVDPEVVVLGGGLSRLDHLYAVVPAVIARHIFADHCRLRLLPPAHGDASGVRGAARLWGNDRLATHA